MNDLKPLTEQEIIPKQMPFCKELIIKDDVLGAVKLYKNLLEKRCYNGNDVNLQDALFDLERCFQLEDKE